MAAGLPTDTVGAERMELVMEVIRAIRNIRGEMDVPPGRQVAALLNCKSEPFTGNSRRRQRSHPRPWQSR